MKAYRNVVMAVLWPIVWLGVSLLVGALWVVMWSYWFLFDGGWRTRGEARQ